MRAKPLDTFRLFKVFRKIHHERSTGLLRLKNDDTQIKITFAVGRPVEVTSNTSGVGLGGALVLKGLISSTELRDLQDEKTQSGQ